MAIEDVFEIRIENKEAETCITPRNVIDLVMGKIHPTDEQVCLTQRSFHLLRRAFAKYGTCRSKFRLSSKLEEIVPKQNRQFAWKRLSSEIGTSLWPKLERPRWLQIIIWSCATILGFWILKKTGSSSSFVASFTTWLLAVFATAWIGYFLTTPFASCFPKGRST
ncbi:MAG: hypothetical protein ABIV39_13310, partial [Verrucomicrobiota bacterium]